MKRYFTLAAKLLTLLAVVSGLCSAPWARIQARDYIQTEWNKAIPNKYFLENKGQVTDQFGKARKDIDFSIAAGKGLNVFVAPGSILYQWNRVLTTFANKPATSVSTVNEDDIVFYRMEIKLLGANKNPQLLKEQKQDYAEKYYTPTAQGVKAQAYERITYKNIYPHIDWVCYFSKAGLMEYDFVVHPGGKVSDIRMQFGGTNRLYINTSGGITAETPMGVVHNNAPYSYDAHGNIVRSNFVLNGNQLSLVTDTYSGKLTIDPVQEWGTYFGGESVDNQAQIRSNGNAYVYMGGHTRSTRNIATTGAWQTSITGIPNANNNDLFLAKFDSTGKRIWATYYGGDNQDFARGLAIDQQGHIYLAGYGRSTGLGTSGVHQDTINNKLNFEGYLVKFDSSGNRIWHTYYGGPLQDVVSSVACDADNNVYITGETSNLTGIATTGSYQSVPGGRSDAFLAKFDGSGKRLWATYFGGEGDDYGYNLTCDQDKSVYICGRTGSIINIATPGAHLTQNMGARISGFFYGYVAYLAKFTPAGERIWATYYSGGMAEGTSLVCDPYYKVYMAGRTVNDSLYTATPGSHQVQSGSFNDGDAFLAKFDSAGTRHWGTYYGGGRSEDGIKIDANSKYIYLTGQTASNNNISTPDAPYVSLKEICTPAGCYPDVFISKFDTAGVRQWATYYGASQYDYQPSITADDYGNFYVGGTTNNADSISLGNVHQDTIGSPGNYDAFLLKFYDCPAAPAPPESITGDDTVCAGSTQRYSITPSEATTYAWLLPDAWTGDSTGTDINLQVGTTEGVHRLKVTASAFCEKRLLTGSAQTMEIYIPTFIPAQITVDGYQLGTSVNYASYQWFKNEILLPGATLKTYDVLENGDYSVIVTDAFGCVDTSDIYQVSNVSVENLDPASGFQMYPNPANEGIYLNLPTQATITIFGLDGREWMKCPTSPYINLRHLPEGAYLIGISNIPGKDNYYRKLIVSRP